MYTGRREFLETAFLGATAALMQSRSSAAPTGNLGLPGPYAGRVIAVEHSGCIASGAYQKEPVHQMVERGMTALTGAPTAQDAWRSMFTKGDVVGIKVSPVGGPGLCSDVTVMHAIMDGLNQAGVPDSDIVIFNRYREEAIACGMDKWVRPGARFAAASPHYDNVQLDMGGYDARSLYGDGHYQTW